jgi:hypothetical protein
MEKTMADEIKGSCNVPVAKDNTLAPDATAVSTGDKEKDKDLTIVAVQDGNSAGSGFTYVRQPAPAQTSGGQEVEGNVPVEKQGE